MEEENRDPRIQPTAYHPLTVAERTGFQRQGNRKCQEDRPEQGAVGLPEQPEQVFYLPPLWQMRLELQWSQQGLVLEPL